MATKKTFICVGCPLGCEVTLTVDAKGEVIGFEGNRCKEGEKYVMEEYKNPVRTLTATVLTRGSSQPLLAVRTARPIGKTLLKKGMTVIAKTTVEPPVKAGDVLVPNLLGSGVDLVASSDLSS